MVMHVIIVSAHTSGVGFRDAEPRSVCKRFHDGATAARLERMRPAPAVSAVSDLPTAAPRPDAPSAVPHPAFARGPLAHAPSTDRSWWRSSVIYQIYPRSFRDLHGSGTGNLAGITAELHQIAGLGVDAVWLSPFYPSPQRDAGYDVSDYTDVDPLFGNLDDFDALIARADDLGLRVIVDLVPNHCSEEHTAFRAALAAGPGSAERELFIFRDGRGVAGQEPPNNWQSHFGGPAWTRVTEPDGAEGQWYLHLFDSSQPDFNWDSQAVHAEFERILRFWLDRGVAGFRVDVAHALVKKPGLPDWGGNANGSPRQGFPFSEAPMFGQPRVHEIYRRWRDILAEYDGERILCAEANAHPVDAVADWVRSDEMQQAFNFPYLNTGWDARALRAVVDRSLAAFDAVGAPSTWVLSNRTSADMSPVLVPRPPSVSATVWAPVIRNPIMSWGWPALGQPPCSCWASRVGLICIRVRSWVCPTTPLCRTGSVRTRTSSALQVNGSVVTAVVFPCPGRLRARHWASARGKLPGCPNPPAGNGSPGPPKTGILRRPCPCIGRLWRHGVGWSSAPVGCNGSIPVLRTG